MKYNGNVQPLPLRHLTNVIVSTRRYGPSYMLLLGAGASVTSGVPTANTLINRWRLQLYQAYGSSAETPKEFLEEQSWYDSPEEYSKLFEKLYDNPTQRREVIESIVESAEPSWGYLYLANILQKGVINTVLTTNFDDLMNEACYRYSSTRPTVCAHDSAMPSIKITSKRPKIIKLHGDFLFDSIKNTTRELESLEQNTKEKLRQFAKEFGLIVVGYAGNDRSIMESLEQLLHDDTNFRSGVYWCVRPEDEPAETVLRLLRFDRVHLVQIPGFDEFAATLHEHLELQLQDEVANPYIALKNRMNQLASHESTRTTRSELVVRDIQKLAETLRKPAGDEGQERIPLTLLSMNALQSGHMEAAITFSIEALRQAPDVESIASALRVVVASLKHEGDSVRVPSSASEEVDPTGAKERSEQIAPAHISGGIESQRSMLIDLVLRSMKSGCVRSVEYDLLTQSGLDLLDVGEFELARSIFQEVAIHIDTDYSLINLAQTYAHQGAALPDALKDRMRSIAQRSNDLLARMGALAVLGEELQAKELLASLDKAGLVDDVMRAWPILRLFAT